MNDELRIYYGGADTSVSLARAKMDDIMKYLRECLRSSALKITADFLRGTGGSIPILKKVEYKTE